MRITSSTYRRLLAVLVLLTLPALALAQSATPPGPRHPKLDRLALAAAARSSGSSRVIVRATNAASLARVAAEVRRAGGTLGRRLDGINGRVALIPNRALANLARDASIEQISVDRPVVGSMERTGAAVRAADVRQALGYDGSGVGVAVIDSGVTAWHDDLSAGGGGQRVYGFVDFISGRDAAYDDYGHGTHVAGIIAGNGFDSAGARTGIAPGAHLLVLKTLDDKGAGRVSDVIAAIDYAIAHRDAYNIRVINLSVATAAIESYETDPLTLAAKRAVAAGIVVVASAGNNGRNAQGGRQYGSITAPGNAPWVITVGASSHMGTSGRGDDTTAAFSSRGPTRFDLGAKPDLLAPGVGIESLSDPASRFYTTRAASLLAGTAATSYLPYLSLSGTSMAAPVVTGTIALMLQANPALTPNAVKAILQYTAEAYAGHDALTQGAGFLNARGAVEFARYFTNPSGLKEPSSRSWSRQLIWANRRIKGGRLTAGANAWSLDVTWGHALTPGGQPVEWGVIYRGGVVQPWGAACADAECGTVTWGAADAPNVVWGLRCGGADCHEDWTLASAGGSVLGTTVVWGTGEPDTVVWGTDEDDTVVWGTDDGDTVVWGTEGVDTVVWGTSADDSNP